MSDPERQWSWGKALGKAVGTGLGAGAVMGVANAVTASPTGPGALAAAGASGGLAAGVGFVAGFFGEVGSYLGDAPKIVWDFRSSTLFGFVISGILTGLFAFSSIELHANNPQVWVVSISALSAFLASALGGMLDNLRLE